MRGRQGLIRAYAVAGVAGVLAHELLPVSWEWLPYLVVTALALAGAVVGLRRNQPSDRVPWRLLILAVTLSLLGSATWYLLEAAGRPYVPAHAIYLAAFGCAVAAAWRIGSRRSAAVRTVVLLDTAIVTTGAAIALWVFVGGPTWASGDLIGLERLAMTAYPMVTLAMIAALVRVVLSGGGRGPAALLMIAGLSGFLLADVANAASELYAWDLAEHPATVRLIGLSLIGLAALHPTMEQLTDATAAGQVRLDRVRLAVLWGAAAIAPLTLAVRTGVGHGGELAVIAVGSLVLFTLVLVRMWGLLRLLAEYVRREHEDRFRAMVENADDIIVVLEDRGRVAYVSPSVRRLWGYEPETFVAEVERLLAPSDLRRLTRAFGTLRRSDERQATVAGQVQHADGGWRRFEATIVDHRDDRAIRGFVATARDVTERWGLERQVAEQRLHDPLTGLPNRTLFRERVAAAVEVAEPGDSSAVLILDLDDFKAVNDVLGPSQGDDVLRDVAHRLVAAARPQDTVARVGGDAFGILIEAANDPHEVTAAASRFLEAIRHELVATNGEVQVVASCGITLGTPGSEATDLLRDADAAMFAAKRDERGGFRVFDPAVQADAARRVQLRMDLKLAVDRGELHVLYQPIQEVGPERMVGMEALLRWQHPHLGSISPVEFIPLAEEAGAIDVLGRFVLDRACAALARFRLETGRETFVTVNVSPLQLYDASFAATVRETIERHRLPASSIMLELTEGIFLQDSDEVSTALDRLREVGVLLAVDDFGTGYCSLGYLSRFRFDVVKIDRSFVDPLADPDGDHRLVLGMIELVGSLELPAVAEGVEVREQADALLDAGCSLAQGYLWSRPVPIDELIGRIRDPVTASSSARR